MSVYESKIQMAYDIFECRITWETSYWIEINPSGIDEVYTFEIPFRINIRHTRAVVETIKFSSLEHQTTLILNVFEESFPNSLHISVYELESKTFWSPEISIEHLDRNLIVDFLTMDSFITQFHSVLSNNRGILRDFENAIQFPKL